MEKETQLTTLYVNLEDKPDSPKGDAPVIEILVNEAPTIDFKKSNTVLLYQSPPNGLGLSLSETGRIVNRHKTTVRQRLLAHGVQPRPLSEDPEIQEAARKSMAERWKNNREINISRIHGEQAKRKRRERTASLDATEPGYRRGGQSPDVIERKKRIVSEKNKSKRRKSYQQAQ